MGTALHSYEKKRWGAVLSDGKGTDSKDVTDPIIYCMQTAMGMLQWAYGVVVNMFDFRRSDRGSNPGRGGKIS